MTLILRLIVEMDVKDRAEGQEVAERLLDPLLTQYFHRHATAKVEMVDERVTQAV